MGELRTRNYIKRLTFSHSASHPMFWLCSQIGFYPVGARNLHLQPYPPVDWNPTERASVSLGIPGGSVVRTPWFPCLVPRCDPCSGELRSRRPQAAWCRQNNKQTQRVSSSLPEALTSLPLSPWLWLGDVLTPEPITVVGICSQLRPYPAPSSLGKSHPKHRAWVVSENFPLRGQSGRSYQKKEAGTALTCRPLSLPICRVVYSPFMCLTPSDASFTKYLLFFLRKSGHLINAW